MTTRTKTTTTAFYNPGHVTAPGGIFNTDGLAPIEGAYRAADLTPPTIDDEARAALDAEPSIDTAARQFAQVAMSGKTGTKKALDDALKQITRAHAADTLRHHYPAYIEELTLEQLPGMIDTAVDKTRPAFNRVVKTLTDAVAHLDPDAPLDRERAFDLDANAHYRAAAAALTKLGQFLMQTTHTDPPRLGAAILPIVTIPDSSPELVTRDIGGVQMPVPNQPGQADRGNIRNLTRDTERLGMDHTLINIALGKYGDTIRFDLATVADLDRRREAHHQAHQRIRKQD